MANPEQLKYETALLTLIATWTGRTIGDNIFQGSLPEKLLESVAVMIDAEIPNNDTTEGLRTYYARYIGKFTERDDAVNAINLIKQNLIKYSENIDIGGGVIIKLHQIRQRGGEAVFETKDDGVRCWNCVLNLTCIFNPGT